MLSPRERERPSVWARKAAGLHHGLHSRGRRHDQDRFPTGLVALRALPLSWGSGSRPLANCSFLLCTSQIILNPIAPALPLISPSDLGFASGFSSPLYPPPLPPPHGLLALLGFPSFLRRDSFVILSFLTLKPQVLPTDSFSLAASGSIGGNKWVLLPQKPKFNSYPCCPRVVHVYSRPQLRLDMMILACFVFL